MPQVGAAVGLALFEAGVVSSIGAAIAVGSVVNSLALNLVLGAVSKALTSKPKQKEASAIAVTSRDRTLAVRQPITVHRVIYGQVRVSGPFTFIHSTDSGQYINFVLTLAGHAVEEIGSIYFNDELIPLDGSGNATGRFAGYVTVKKGLGTTAGDADLLSSLRTNCPDVWTANHKQAGRAKLYVRLKFNQDLFPNGIPNVTAIVKGKQLYDPRTGLTGYSTNAALCVRDYLANTTYGLGEPATAIYDTSFIAAANICDENVALAAGGTEKRYTCNGTVDTDRKPKDVLESLLTAMAGKLAYQGGKWNLYAGAYRTPTVSLNEDDLDGPIKLTTRLSRREIFNGVKGVYVSPADFYQPTDFPPVTNATYLSEDQGERIWKDIDLQFTTSAATAQRLAKIELEKARQQMTTVWPCNLKAFRIQAGDVVYLNNARFGWVNKPFEVDDWQFSIRGNNDAPQLGIDLYMRETASAVYDWNSGNETTVDVAPNTTLPNPFTVIAPGIPVVTESKYVTNEGAGVKVRAIVSWVGMDRYASSYQLEHKLASASTWTVHPRTHGTSENIDDIAPGIYDFRVKSINTLGVSSDYSSVTKEIYGLSDIPADVGGFAVIKIGGIAQAQWNAAADIDVLFGGYIVIRHSPMTSGATWNDGVILDTFDGNTVNGLLPLMTGTYMAKAIDSRGIYSSGVASFVATEGMVTGFTTVATSTQHAAFSGAKTNIVKVDDIIKLDNTDLFDSAELFDSSDPIDGGNIADSGSYAFDTHLDMGTVATRRFEANIAALNFDTMDLFDNDEMFDSASVFDGSTINDCDATLYCATTNDDPAGNPTWGAWTPFFVADFTCRAAKFKLDLESRSVNSNISISALTVNVKVPT